MEESMKGMTSPVGVRIFVGGLSENVAEEDLKKTFGSLCLGKLEGLEIIRSKGRSFAYFSFFPSSPTSLSKLLSTYNGCIWKGGKLRLEKAKEHYLVRLRREWAEDADLSKASSDTVDSTGDTVNLDKPQKDLHSEGHLRIFFPKLRKVKAIPSQGTGKHKYSFQRVDVPLLPKYFCDCEEHSDPPPSLQNNTNEVEAQNGGINAEEIDMMNSVMDKLFQRENVLRSGNKLVKGNGTSLAMSIKQQSKGNVTNLTEEYKLEENKPDYAEDENEDEDMVINITRTKANIPDEFYSFSTNQKSDSKKRWTSEDVSANNMLKAQKSSSSPSRKKIKKLADGPSNDKLLSASTPEEKNKLQMNANMTGSGAELHLTKSDSDTQQNRTLSLWSQKSSWKALAGDSHNGIFSISHVLPGANTITKEKPNSDNKGVPIPLECKEESLFREEEGSGQKTQDLKKVEEAQCHPTTSNAASNKSERGVAWLHKSSWTQLIAEEKNRPFSISQILSAGTSEKKKVLDTENINSRAETLEEEDVLYAKYTSIGNSTDKNWQEKALEDGSEALSTENEELPFETQNSSIASASKDQSVHTSGISVSINKAPTTMPLFDQKQFSISISEECPFMRSEASLRDWAKSKAALSGSRKRKK